MKTKHIGKLYLLGLIWATPHVYAQSAYYYHAGQRVPLGIDSTKVSVLRLRTETGKVVRSTVQETVGTARIIWDTLYEIRIMDLVSEENKAAQNALKAIGANRPGDNTGTEIVLPVYRNARSEELISTPYVNVRLKKGEDKALLDTIAARYRLQKVRSYTYLPLWYTLCITPETKKNTVEVANEIYETGWFASSFPDLSQEDYLSCVSEPDFGKQWGLYNDSILGIDISVCRAWTMARGKGINIAIIDNGVDKTHPDLSANIHPLSYDTETGTSPSRLYGGEDYVHGTHCAGIAAAALNGKYMAGVAPEAKIMAVSNQYGANASVKMADGISWAWQHGADILSCSWRAALNDALDEAIDMALSRGRNGKGAILVFSSGNHLGGSVPLGGTSIGIGDEIVRLSHDVTYPANSRPEILVVGAVGKNGRIASFSCYGEEVDVCAPGVGIYSAYPQDSMVFSDGTSMACPHVAGIAALILDRNRTLTGQEVRDIIEKSTKKIARPEDGVWLRPNGIWNEKYGYGLVDAHAALQATPPCPDSYLTEQDISEDLEERGCNVLIRNVTVKKGVTLTIDAEKEIVIDGFFEAPLGSELELKIE